MPDLPTINVTAAQATRIQDAFGGVEQYRAWLRDAIRSYVKIKEQQALRTKFESDVQASANAVDTELSGMT